MKGFLKYWLAFGLIFSPAIYAYTESVELSNECAGCQYSNPWAGFYLGLNGGRSWYSFSLHRASGFAIESFESLFPLNHSDWRNGVWVPVPVLGWDFYPKLKMPLRLEANFTYADFGYSLNPAFGQGLDPNTGYIDNLRIYNSMLTMYVDLHTCTRFVPYVGVSGGFAALKSSHQIEMNSSPIGRPFRRTEKNFSWGATIGSRFFFTQHVVGNVQFRFNDLNQVVFLNTEPQDIPLPEQKDYSTDYFHETSVLLGIAYIF